MIKKNLIITTLRYIMFRRYTLFILLLTITFSNFINSFVSYYLLLNKETGQSLLLLGDFHKEQLDEQNEQDAATFIKRLDFLSNKLDKTIFNQIPFVMELNEISAKKFLESDNSGLRVARTFVCLMNYAISKKDETIINFQYYEPRKDESDAVEGCLEFLQSNISENLESNNILFPQFIIALREHFSGFKKNTTLPEVTLEQYLKSLHNGLGMLNQWQSNYGAETAIGQEIERIKKIYSDALVQVISYFVKTDPTISLELALLDIISSCETFSGAFKKCMELEHLLLVNIDYVFADIGFLNYILEQQDKCSKIIFLAGAKHVSNIANHLQKLGYVILNQQNAIIELGDAMFIDKNKLKITSKESNTCLKMFLDPAFPSNPVQLSQCSWCKITNDEKKPLICSRCKKAYYCNRTCQKNHWFWHKDRCEAEK